MGMPIKAMRMRRAGPVGDPYFSSVVSLLHCDGSDGSTTFTDAFRTWTASGNAQLDTAEKKFGTAAGLCDGVGDFISTPHADPALIFGTDPFTMEGWIRPVLGADRGFLSKRQSGTAGWALEVRSTGAIWVRARIGATWSDTFLASATGAVTAGTWYHWAWVRDGNNWYFYLDGVSVASATNSGTLDNVTAASLRIGRSASTDEDPYSGHFDEVRITKGVCRYPGGTTFTPPTAAFPDS